MIFQSRMISTTFCQITIRLSLLWSPYPRADQPIRVQPPFTSLHSRPSTTRRRRHRRTRRRWNGHRGRRRSRPSRADPRPCPPGINIIKLFFNGHRRPTSQKQQNIFKMAHLRSLFIYYRLFKHTIQFYTKYVKNVNPVYGTVLGFEPTTFST